MPRCANGHLQGLVLKCSTCGADVSYRDACAELVKLPEVGVDFGAVRVMTAGFPTLLAGEERSSAVAVGDAPSQTPSTFVAPRIQGGNWLDYHARYAGEVNRWLRLTGFDRSACRFAVVDATSPAGVMAVASLPKKEKTVVIALVADATSTPVELSASYAAVTKALGMGFPVIALGQDFVREALLFEEARVFISQAEAVGKMIRILVANSSEVVDLMERDLHLGVRVHCLSAVISGSKQVYGGAVNALTAAGFGISIEAAQDDVRTFYPLVFADEGVRAEFVRGFAQVRTKQYPKSLSAECLFHPAENGGFFDIVSLLGVGDEVLLGKLAPGYDAVLQRIPGLNVEKLT